MARPELQQRISLEPSENTGTSLRNFLRRLGMREQALLYLIWLGVAEMLVSIWEPRAGMVMHGAILMALLIHAVIYARGLWQKFLIALTLAPLIRLLSLTMPLSNFPLVYWYLVVGAPLFIATILTMRFGGLSSAMVGLTARKPAWQVLVGFTGLGFGLLEYLILRPDPLVEEMRWRTIWLPALILLICTGFLEEFIFRGVMQYTAQRRLGRFGILYVTLVFVVMHIGYRSLLDLMFVFAVALFFAYVVRRTGSILGVSLAHGLINIGLFLIFPFILATPAEQLPALQDTVIPHQRVSATPIIVQTLTNTPSTTLAPMTPIRYYSSLASDIVLAPTETSLSTTPICCPKAGWIYHKVIQIDSWRNVGQHFENLLTPQLLLSMQ